MVGAKLLAEGHSSSAMKTVKPLTIVLKEIRFGTVRVTPSLAVGGGLPRPQSTVRVP